MWLLNHYLTENLLIYQGHVEDVVICDTQAGTCFELAANSGKKILQNLFCDNWKLLVHVNIIKVV
jgi:hypothetical protein